MYFIGYDIGNANIKAALFDGESNRVVEVIQYPNTGMDMISRRTGWAEQQPELWWMHFCMATRKLLSQTGVNPAEIEAIGIAYQMHGLVLIDSDGQVLRPAIIWCDGRAVKIGQQAFEEIGEKYCLENFLNSPGNFTASKLKWVKDHEPDIYQKIDKVMLPGDFIAYKLTGEKQTTVSGLSEAILWNFQEKRIAHEVLDYFELSSDVLPGCVPTFSIQGRVSQEAADLTGLASGTPLSYRAGDQPNNALSLNVLNPGEIAAISDTSGVVYGIVDRPTFDMESRVNAFAHVNYEENFDRIGVLLCINGAGTLYHWMKHQVAHHSHDYPNMERMAASVPPGADGLVMLPFGNGAERMLDNRNVNAQLANLQFNRHKRAHLYRAALEGVGFAFAEGVNLLKAMGLETNVIRVGNDNMFQSNIFATTIATLLNCEIEVVDTTGAIGAARAAGVATGYYASLQEALSGVHTSTVYEPDADSAPVEHAYHAWQSWLQHLVHGSAANRPTSTPALQRHLTKLQSENIRKDKDLAQNTLEILSQRELLKEARSELQNMRKGMGNPERVRQLCKRIDSQLEEKENWENFELYFDVLHGDLLRQLKTRFPDLSQKEIQLCALIRMDLSTKDIAQKLHISTRGVETRRYRLRKKLGLPANDNINDLLDQLASPLSTH
ncbi:MAG: FGGY family carbohydrate kinase [Bacteroidia bacterium]|nr:FGGY family carbohydrate kinase [Bacteroidia bacterium]